MFLNYLRLKLHITKIKKKIIFFRMWQIDLLSRYCPKQFNDHLNFQKKINIFNFEYKAK